MKRTKDPITRFWPKVDKTDNCWNWTAAKVTDGYGVITIDGKHVMAHRFSYQIHKGPIPPGLVVDHMCHNPACVNPQHLQAVTHKQNCENQAGPHRDNRTGVRGVIKHHNGYRGQVVHRGVVHRTKTFPTVAEAGAAVTALRNTLHTNNLADRLSS